MAEPFCGNCGYTLTGLTESSKCPECGRPLVEVLQRHYAMPRSRRYTSPAVIFGLPLVQVAFGPSERERIGRARAIIALGDVATGWLAIGGRATGLLAIGGLAMGMISIGGCALGLLALGGWAVGGFALGGGALGVLAFGGGAVGLIAEGGGAAGYFVHAGGAWGVHVVAPGRSDPEAMAVFARLHRWLGAPPGSPLLILNVTAWFAALAMLLALPFAAAVLLRYRRWIREQDERIV